MLLCNCRKDSDQEIDTATGLLPNLQIFYEFTIVPYLGPKHSERA